MFNPRNASHGCPYIIYYYYYYFTYIISLLETMFCGVAVMVIGCGVMKGCFLFIHRAHIRRIHETHSPIMIIYC